MAKLEQFCFQPVPAEKPKLALIRQEPVQSDDDSVEQQSPAQAILSFLKDKSPRRNPELFDGSLLAVNNQTLVLFVPGYTSLEVAKSNSQHLLRLARVDSLQIYVLPEKPEAIICMEQSNG